MNNGTYKILLTCVSYPNSTFALFVIIILGVLKSSSTYHNKSGDFDTFVVDINQ